MRQRVTARLGPIPLGALDSLGSVLAITAAFVLATVLPLSPKDLPSELFWHLAEIGAGLFVAYSVALVGVGPRIGEPEHKKWLASSCALGVLSLSAIGVSLVLASFRDAADAGSIEIVGLCWIAANLILLGAFIALLPVIAASWRESPEGD